MWLIKPHQLFCWKRPFPQKVLVSWTLVALLNKEQPASGQVEKLLQKAADGHAYLALSIINLGERSRLSIYIGTKKVSLHTIWSNQFPTAKAQ
jgi:hypothetical protein